MTRSSSPPSVTVIVLILIIHTLCIRSHSEPLSSSHLNIDHNQQLHDDDDDDYLRGRAVDDVAATSELSLSFYDNGISPWARLSADFLIATNVNYIWNTSSGAKAAMVNFYGQNNKIGFYDNSDTTTYNASNYDLVQFRIKTDDLEFLTSTTLNRQGLAIYLQDNRERASNMIDVGRFIMPSSPSSSDINTIYNNNLGQWKLIQIPMPWFLTDSTSTSNINYNSIVGVFFNVRNIVPNGDATGGRGNGVVLFDSVKFLPKNEFIISPAVLYDGPLVMYQSGFRSGWGFGTYQNAAVPTMYATKPFLGQSPDNHAYALQASFPQAWTYFSIGLLPGQTSNVFNYLKDVTSISQPPSSSTQQQDIYTHIQFSITTPRTPPELNVNRNNLIRQATTDSFLSRLSHLRMYLLNAGGTAIIGSSGLSSLGEGYIILSPSSSSPSPSSLSSLSTDGGYNNLTEWKIVRIPLVDFLGPGETAPTGVGGIGILSIPTVDNTSPPLPMNIFFDNIQLLRARDVAGPDTLNCISVYIDTLRSGFTVTSAPRAAVRAYTYNNQTTNPFNSVYSLATTFVDLNPIVLSRSLEIPLHDMQYFQFYVSPPSAVQWLLVTLANSTWTSTSLPLDVYTVSTTGNWTLIRYNASAIYQTSSKKRDVMQSSFLIGGIRFVSFRIRNGAALPLDVSFDEIRFVNDVYLAPPSHPSPSINGDPNALAGGAIAAIVVCLVVFLIAIIIVAILLARRRRQTRKRQPIKEKGTAAYPPQQQVGAAAGGSLASHNATTSTSTNKGGVHHHHDGGGGSTTTTSNQHSIHVGDTIDTSSTNNNASSSSSSSPSSSSISVGGGGGGGGAAVTSVVGNNKGKSTLNLKEKFNNALESSSAFIRNLGGTGSDDLRKSSSSNQLDVMDAEACPFLEYASLAIVNPPIGKGAYGIVNKATWNGEIVAVKTYLPDCSKDVFQDFAKEVSMLSRIQHPNIVRLMGYCMDPYAMIMEYMEHGSLFELIHRHPEQLTFKRALNIMRDTARGLTFLHEREPPVMHRDLKSHNILIGKNYSGRISDFGISRPIVSSTMTASVGTMRWNAPEAMRGGHYTISADVYSFGLLLWEVAHKGLPFEGYSWDNQIEDAVLAGTRPIIKSEELKLPERYVDLIKRCWHQDPTMRPTCRQILETLEDL